MLSVIIAHLWALKVIGNSKLGVSQSTKFCVASCNCCHDPFIVRSAQTCPPFAGVTQLAHPSRCSRSTLATVCLSAHASPWVSVFTSGFCSSISGLQPFTRSIVASAAFILLWSVGSMVSRIPILQTCNVVVVLKRRLERSQHLRSSSP